MKKELKEMVIVEWVDVAKKTNDDAFDPGCDIDSRPATMETIGWLYQKSEKTILLVQEYYEGEPRDWIAIPRMLIKKIIPAKKDEKKAG